MYGGRQAVAIWGSFAVGCILVPLLERPIERGNRATQAADNVAHPRLPVEGTPFAGSSPYSSDVIAAATRWGLDPALVLAVVETESGELADAVSPRGAVGLMQVLPGTVLELGLPDTANPADPRQNLDAGCHYLASLLESFGGDVELSLAAYNAGPGAVRTWGTVPPYRETREFIARVGAAYQRMTGLTLRGATRFTAEPLALL